eukprot:m.101573 g.101573  ORF g.101573 m.101573 type:complete len:939 (+) comp13746_c0_seq3:117-2933(+)
MNCGTVISILLVFILKETEGNTLSLTSPSKLLQVDLSTGSNKLPFRPDAITYNGTDFKSNIDIPYWYNHVSDHMLFNLETQPYTTYEIHSAALPISQQVSNCSTACSSTAICFGWDLIKVTPTSGKKLPLCRLFSSKNTTADMSITYTYDPNFECGSKEAFSNWFGHVPNNALNSVVSYKSYEIPGLNEPGLLSCYKACQADTICLAWNLIKVTKTSGKSNPFCQLYNSTSTASYGYDENFESGSKLLLPKDSTPKSSQMPSSPCVSIFSEDLNETRVCLASEKSDEDTFTISYSAHNLSIASWELNITYNNSKLSMSGDVALVDYVIGEGLSSALEWNIVNLSSPYVTRAIELHYPIIGLGPSSTLYMSSQSKTWCPPGEGCQEWAQRNIGDENDASLEKGGWVPPYLPVAHQALVDPSRSQGIVGVDGIHASGFSGWASQHTFAMKGFRTENSTGAGPARINLNLRCGSVLPYKLKFGMFNDITADGLVNTDDGLVWERSQYRQAHYAYRMGLVWKLGNDYSSYKAQESYVPISFNETLGIVKQIDYISDGQMQSLHLVGWQGTGHDTLYPSYNVVNAKVGTLSDLQNLVSQTKDYMKDAIISYHINTDEAYWNYTIPGPLLHTHNPECNRTILATEPNGSAWIWQCVGGTCFTDPLSGPSFHISKAKDYSSGHRWNRYKEFVDYVPNLTHTLHMDAWRDIDTSFENDERGYIAEDEEFECGCKNDAQYFNEKGIYLGVEGQNGMASDPRGVVDYYWHGRDTIRNWGRIVVGTSQGLDNDITATTKDNVYELLVPVIYMKAKTYAVQLTSDALDSALSRFAGGGNRTHWPWMGQLIEYQRATSRFLPKVLKPGSLRSSDKTTLSTNTAYVYEDVTKSLHVWSLPNQWCNNTLALKSLDKDGSRIIPSSEFNVTSHGNACTLSLIVKPKVPIVVTCM